MVCTQGDRGVWVACGPSPFRFKARGRYGVRNQACGTRRPEEEPVDGGFPVGIAKASGGVSVNPQRCVTNKGRVVFAFSEFYLV